MAHSFVIIGGGPAGNQAATYAARLGAQVTMIEREIVGGAAHLLDCIPSKTMIATGGAISFGQRIGGMGLADASTT
ncbi:MAG: FAD-dependent oxidoreductase, partial [Actinomycetota bacterium]|nr:FAD-dependent oxidoreductase [Actinomycetota bacterium]